MQRLALSIIGLLLWLTSLPLHAQEPADGCAAMGGRPNFGNPENPCVLFTGLDITINYPLEQVKAAPIVQENVDTLIYDSRDHFIEMFLERGIDDQSLSGAWTLIIEYEEFRHSEQVMSLRFSMYSYSGGIHGFPSTTTMTFDLVQNKRLVLDDLFLPDSEPLEVIAPLAAASLLDQLRDFPEHWIGRGSSPEPENYAFWLLTADELIFYFQRYQVAPYSAGTLTVNIPLTELADILKPEYLPATGK